MDHDYLFTFEEKSDIGLGMSISIVHFIHTNISNGLLPNPKPHPEN